MMLGQGIGHTTSSMATPTTGVVAAPLMSNPTLASAFATPPPPAQGTDGVNFTESYVREGFCTVAVQTITIDDAFRGYSFEELRSIDYANGKKSSQASSALRNYTRHNLHLIKGPGIEVVVGQEGNPSDLFRLRQTWNLPKALISYYSPFLKAACSHPFQENEENRITLPHDDAKVFALFVEWMYYGAYKEEASPFRMFGTLNAIVHARAWVLGDKLMATGFKNYAMGRIYTSHNKMLPAATVDIVHACENSMIGSALRSFYIDFVGTHFGDKAKVVGDLLEWDQVLLEYDDARIFLLKASMAEPSQRKFIKGVEAYFEGAIAGTGLLGK
ncbi:hypothetical protein CC80DRAFT_466906 [Byssothecium circinans]|uniref:BTB domain-containing protein n=1 Tax=Byssothecium circinans TaxID=147558 RepID=A0A6A5U4K2_9PLEO|nr:hypothetical protein CC80DRAFT_466906 [Byssothecium circinans]